MTGGGVVVLDIDTSDPALVAWAIDHCGDTPMKCRTPRGGLHLYYRTEPATRCRSGVRIGGRPYDLRWNGCFAVCPWSVNAEGTPYAWIGPVLPAAELPAIRTGTLLGPRDVRPLPVACAPYVGGHRDIRNVRAYIRRIISVQGARGSDACFRVACILRDAGQTAQEALECIHEWNRYCAVPPWSVPELEKKIRDAYSKIGITD
jgi:hypothetical protein